MSREIIQFILKNWPRVVYFFWLHLTRSRLMASARSHEAILKAAECIFSVRQCGRFTKVLGRLQLLQQEHRYVGPGNF